MSYTGILGTIPNIPQPTGGGGEQVFFLNNQTVNNNYTVPANINAGSFGPITVAASATVTIPSSSTLTVI